MKDNSLYNSTTDINEWLKECNVRGIKVRAHDVGRPMKCDPIDVLYFSAAGENHRKRVVAVFLSYWDEDKEDFGMILK
jgi:hypothetical protein